MIFQSFFRLIRINVSLAVTFSAYVAYAVCSHGMISVHLVALAGIFLLAAGASALNQYQEREFDAKMDRTLRRPIPLNIFSPRTALIIAVILILAGLVILTLVAPLVCLLLGIFNVIWYNGFYTWLKKKTPFAVVPGALTGVVPVLMGWTAAGCTLNKPEAILIAAFIFLWQVPHFWLLMVVYTEDYRKAGFPVIEDVFSPRQIRTVTFAWLVASSAASMLLLQFKIFTFLYSTLIVLFLSVTLILLVINQFFIMKVKNYRLLFIAVNLYMFLVLALLAIEKTWN